MTTVLTLARRTGLVLGLPAVLFAVWWFATAGSTDFYVPPLSTILGKFGDVWTGERLLSDVVPSLVRLLVGYVLAVAAGVGLGLLVGLHRRVEDVVAEVDVGKVGQPQRHEVRASFGRARIRATFAV